MALPDSGNPVGRAWLKAHDLTDSEVSSAHLSFERVGGVLGVVDLDSRNGTWVNGTRLPPQQRQTLEDGALLRLGRTLFVVCSQLRGPLAASPPVGELVGPYGLRDVAATLDALCASQPPTVLIEGETGVGKELLARHAAKRLGRGEPYCAVNVAGMAAGVFESQLFGHVAGAFSGSSGGSPGIVVAHDGGTIFLDEIGELPLNLQAKLLRLLDNREVLAVGASQPRTVDVLFLAATHQSLERMVEEGSFRADLYARLARARLRLPPLRERKQDIYPIVLELAARSGIALEKEAVEVEAVERLMQQPWPRNVRQLQSALEDAKRADPGSGLSLWSLDKALGAAPAAQGVLTESLVAEALAASDGNVSQAAKRLGVSRGKLLRFRNRGGVG